MLWIRSQDRKMLVPADKEIDYLEFKEEGQFKYRIYCGTLRLGEYETEERCVQIMNEIQGALILPLIKDGINLRNNYAYKMPEQ